MKSTICLATHSIKAARHGRQLCGLEPQPRQLVVVVPMLRKSTVWFLERPNHMPRIQHPLVAQ